MSGVKTDLRAHKGLRDDFEKAAKYFNIPYTITEDGDGIVIHLTEKRKHDFYHGFFSGDWRKKECSKQTTMI